MAAPGQRAFAQKLNKQGAAEVRRQVSSTVLFAPPELTKSVSGLNLAVAQHGQGLHPADGIEPPDFEDFVIQNQCLIERDPFRDLLLYPEDDIEVHQIPRTCRTVSPVVPEISNDMDPIVSDCIKRYTSEYTAVTRRYQKYSSSFYSKDRLSELDGIIHQEYEIDVEDAPSTFDRENTKRQSIHMNETPRGSWASSIFDLKQSQADALLPNLFDRKSSEEVDKQNEDQRQQNRQDNIFSLFTVQDDDEGVEKRPPAPIPAEHFGHKILVKCLQLSLEMEVEPVFISMALYDARERKKISETFHFDLNSEHTKHLIGMHVPHQDISTLSRSCIFSLTYPSPDVFLVVRLEKVLQQGDISECAEPYMKEDKSAKEEKYRANAVQFCERLGKYRMPFAWTAIYLMNIVTGGNSNSLEREASVEKNSESETSRATSLDRRSGNLGGQMQGFRRQSKDDLATAGRRGSVDRGRSGYDKRRSWSPDSYGASLDNFRPVTLTVSSFFKQESDKLSDDDLYKFLADLKRPSSVLKRVKCIPATLKLDISPCPEEPKYTLTAELAKVDPYPDDKGRPTKEITEFPSKEVYMPYTSYKNSLYIYPKYLNFSTRQGSARNLAVKIQFMAGEEEIHALPVIYGKSSCPEFTREAYSAVTYHNKSPDLYEEVKAKLPAKLTEFHHIMFTFYHISCQVKKNEPTPTEIPVGYTWLPLMRDNHLVVGEFSLPVCIERPPPRYSMLHPDVKLPNMKWVDNQKGVFNVVVKAVSSVHPQDEHIDRFLHLCQAAQEQKLPPRMTEISFETELKRSIMDITRAKGENLVQFLSLILDKLILLLVRPPVIAGNMLNVGQNTFEAIAQVVQQVHELLEEKNDQNGRNTLLASYIQYSCSLAHPTVNSQNLSPVLSPSLHSQGYATLGRPSSLPISKQAYQRSTSNPDLAGLTPTSPDAEVAGFIIGRQLDRTGSMKGDEFSGQNYAKVRGKKYIHEELALQWVVSSGSTRELALGKSWFFFELMIKAMAEHLDQTDRLCSPRQMRFSDHFIDDVSSLISNLIKDIVERHIKEPPLIKALNTSLAFFLHDLLSLVDRGLVFSFISQYCEVIASRISQLSDPTSLMLLRLDFLRIICSHEHYYPLNLPFGTPLTMSGGASSPTPSSGSATSHSSFASNTSTSTLTDKGIYYSLSADFRRQHYLVGLVLADLASALDTFNSAIHQRAINVVRNLLFNHDLDIRYMNPDIKCRLAALYLPLVSIVIEALPQLYDPYTEGRQRNSNNFDEEGDKISQKLAMAIAGSTFFSRATDSLYDPSEAAAKARKCQLSADSTQNLLICFLWVLKNADHSVLKHWWSELPMTKLSPLLEVIYYAVSNFEYKAKWAMMNLNLLSHLRLLSSSEETLEDWQDSPTNTTLRPKSHTLPKSQSLHEQLWEGIQKKSHDLLRGTGTLLNRSFSRDDPATQVQGKKLMAQYSQQTLKKSVDMKSKLEDAILGTGSARSDMMRRRGTASSLAGDHTPPLVAPEGGGSRLRWRKDQLQWRHSLEIHDRVVPLRASTKPRDVDSDAHVEGSLAAEVSVISLDILEIIVQIAQSSEMMSPLLGSALRVLLHMLGLNQSVLVLQNMFAIQRALVTKFLDLLFEEETEQCADLCLRLLRHCSSCIGNTRAQASASLYLLMRQNFELGNNFARVKMQVTMSLSSLVGQNQNFNEEYLRKSLKTILTYAEADVELQETTFPEQVRDLVFNLHMILSDTVKMKEFQEDPEMLLDLMYRIAKGYQTSPDLRLTWLQNMAGKHSEKGNHAEAAQCLVHAAGLVAEYLNMLEDKPYLPVGCVAFQKITPNILEESAVSDDVVSPDEEGICTGKYFTENGLIGLLEQSASSFTMGGLFEAVNQVYKILLPIHEASRDYKKLAHIHQKLQEAFNNVIKQEGKRIFGTYFRVGFYGTKFGDLDGDEFVYKEQSITKLSEISFRLESFYGDRFGYDVLHMIKDSNTVEKEKLDPNKAYIQITYVEPYFDMYEFRERITYFDKNYNIRRFMYATPFTLDGRAHGELHEQYKRKTILTTSHSFPYVKTRMQVIERQQIILSPVEVAIEDVQKKTKELALALRQEPPDTKILQMVLQGCIGTTVNQGPLEVALVFLADVAEGKQLPSRHHNKLRLCFKDFLKKCGDALHRNKSLITHEQKEYQRELERNYHTFKEKLLPMISNSTTLRRSRHHKSKEGKERKRMEHNVTTC
ncbi:dedicator of cytokinesis protein 7-like isoform X2 [Gigantopelta aegis]|uniref:dedicator of cytokinesis protein 7-like isoform X2 n=1 Tax=Gigantopelta aegis TaxID=1735272 RepID=UPI001B889153|nr:dedicator of cytokinesis protein 7-like isoform X2 [Gigantopelta aegis]